MLQWEWPKVWSPEHREVVRAAIETSIRSVMSHNSNAQIRGKVMVELPNLGASPPELVLSGIRELSVEHTAIMVNARYSGDFSVTLRGLEINLDTIGSGDDGTTDGNYASPFFCPLDLTLHDIRIDGMASIEVFQELERDTQYVETDVLDTRTCGGPRPKPRSFNSSAVANAQLIGSTRSATTSSPSTQHSLLSREGAAYSSGYGVLLGAGGRRAMRLPDAQDMAGTGPPGALSSESSSAESRGVGPGTPQKSTEPFSIIDIISKRAIVKRRSVKVQLFGDPVKSFKVTTNFASVQAANRKVEGTIKMLLKPTINRMMTEGLTITI